MSADEQVEPAVGKLEIGLVLRRIEPDVGRGYVFWTNSAAMVADCAPIAFPFMPASVKSVIPAPFGATWVIAGACSRDR